MQSGHANLVPHGSSAAHSRTTHTAQQHSSTAEAAGSELHSRRPGFGFQQRSKPPGTARKAKGPSQPKEDLCTPAVRPPHTSTQHLVGSWFSLSCTHFSLQVLPIDFFQPTIYLTTLTVSKQQFVTIHSISMATDECHRCKIVILL